MKICFIGFSITEEKNGYIEKLKKKFIEDYDIDVDIDHKAIGGSTFTILPYIIDSILDEKYDHVIFEISSCYRFLKRIEDYLELLDEIKEKTYSHTKNISFLSLYRNNIDYNLDILVTSINYFCIKNDFKHLNLINLVNSDNIDKVLRDGIHTTEYGSELYASEIKKHIENNLLNCTTKDKKTILTVDDLKITTNGSPYTTSNFKRGNISFDIAHLNENTEYIINFDADYIIEGVFYLQTPESGSCLLDFNNGFKRNIHCFDEFCYYKRYSYQMLPPQKTKRLTFYQNDTIPKINLKKGIKNSNKREFCLVGLLVRSNKFKA